MHFTQDNQIKLQDSLGLFDQPLESNEITGGPIKPDFSSHPVVGWGEQIPPGIYPSE